jgi:hypothetical protein
MLNLNQIVLCGAVHFLPVRNQIRMQGNLKPGWRNGFSERVRAFGKVCKDDIIEAAKPTAIAVMLGSHGAMSAEEIPRQ